MTNIVRKETLKISDATQTEDSESDKEGKCTRAEQQELQAGGKGNAPISQKVEDAGESRYERDHASKD